MTLRHTQAVIDFANNFKKLNNPKRTACFKFNKVKCEHKEISPASQAFGGVTFIKHVSRKMVTHTKKNTQKLRQK